MNIYLRVFVMFVSILVFTGVVFMLVRKKFSESDSILWFLIAIVAVLSGFFPEQVEKLSFNLGIQYPPTLVFIISIVFLVFIVFRNNSKISMLNAKVKELSIQLSILKHNVEADKKNLEKETDISKNDN